MKKYSLTQAGNLVKMVSAILVIFGAQPFSEEETNSILVVIGLLGETIGFLMSWFGRIKAGGIDLLGRKVDTD